MLDVYVVTLKDAKDRARAIARAYGVKYTRALEIVARESNFDSWAKYRDSLFTPEERQQHVEDVAHFKLRATNKKRQKYRMRDREAHKTNVWGLKHKSAVANFKSHARPINTLAVLSVYKPRKED